MLRALMVEAQRIRSRPGRGPGGRLTRSRWQRPEDTGRAQQPRASTQRPAAAFFGNYRRFCQQCLVQL